MEERFANVVKNYEAAISDLSGRLASGLKDVGNSLEASMQKVAVNMQSQEESLMTSRRQIAQEESQRLADMMREIQAEAAKVAADYQQTAKDLQATTRESAEKSLQAAGSLAERMLEITRLAQGIQDLLKIGQAVEKSMEGITGAEDFRSTLQDLRQHLATTDAFCSRLSKPRVITLREEVS